MLLVDCSNCRTPLILPPGAHSIRCMQCNGITQILSPHQPPSHHAGHPFAHPPHHETRRLSSHHFQSSAPPSPFSSFISRAVHPAGNKRAVIIGITYKNSDANLTGCLNDAKCMKHLLVSKFNFPESSIVMLTEYETDPLKIPTKVNIRMAMKWLVQGTQAGDSLVFYFSGHGSQKRDVDGDEADGFDETLLPLDFENEGIIVDDEINYTIVRPLPAGAKLHAIVDACHSGTILDLPFVCKIESDGEYWWDDQSPKSGVWKGTNGGEAISISGCDDHQTSIDTPALAKVTSTGAMTFAFIQAIEQGHGRTYGELLSAMRSTVHSVSSGLSEVEVVTALLIEFMTGRPVPIESENQEPQLCSNQQFDLSSKPFYL